MITRQEILKQSPLTQLEEPVEIIVFDDVSPEFLETLKLYQHDPHHAWDIDRFKKERPNEFFEFIRNMNQKNLGGSRRFA